MSELRDVDAYCDAFKHFDDVVQWDGAADDAADNAIDQSDEDGVSSALFILHVQDGLDDSGDEIVLQIEEQNDGGSWSDRSESVKVTDSDHHKSLAVDLEGAKDQVRGYLDSSASTVNAADERVAVECILFGGRTV